MDIRCKVKVLNEAFHDEKLLGNDWVLCLQWCKYVYSNGEKENGYRFIWRRPNKSLQAARGQARIPSIELMSYLINEAKKQGWGDYKASGHIEF